MIAPPNPNANNNNCVILNNFEQDFQLATPPRKPPRNFAIKPLTEPCLQTVAENHPSVINTSCMTLSPDNSDKSDSDPTVECEDLDPVETSTKKKKKSKKEKFYSAIQSKLGLKNSQVALKALTKSHGLYCRAKHAAQKGVKKIKRKIS